MKLGTKTGRLAGMLCAALCACAVQAQSYGDLNQPGDPRSKAKIHTELGAAYFQAGNPAVALEHLDTALKTDSDFFQAYSVRGLVYGSLKEYDKAEQDFQRALKIAPNDPEVNNNYGWFLCDTGKERQSVSYFLNALKNPLYETPDIAYANAGTCALKSGDLDGAQHYLLQALQLSRDGGAHARLQLAKLFYLRGNLDESRVYLNEVMKQVDSPTAEALWLAVRLERKLGNKAAESGFAAQLRGRYPTSPEYQAFLKGNFE
ncbi:type IV pilus biogenesis/stability protein PilW [Azonexus sp.]|jgi:type IV pilus assembly protein PilF|uniref:type IV pilus biogenesis/stability protein PilW n=1 Tax=Azonexus sp. TaxID=1872668 RepID=UPI00281B56DB|nr:type IV pilus biogenesis/stability protein PilW [Azonexus sp.]MDR1996045.1 type IV pilus biogenesis/stability protein PilW [Azonexus sp.]